MKKSKIWWSVVGGALLFSLMLVLVVVTRKGIGMEKRAPMLDYLNEGWRAEEGGAAASRLLVAYDPNNEAEEAFVTTLTDALDAMHAPWTKVALGDVASRLAGNGADEIYLCAQDLSPLADCAVQLFSWVEAGGRLALMMTPSDNEAFRLIYRKLGIVDYGAGYVEYSALRFLEDDIMPFWEVGDVYAGDGDFNDYTLGARLEDDCEVLIETGDDRHFPLFWKRGVGKGRVAVCDTTLVSGKDSRGLAQIMVLALEDTAVYPIVNAAMVFIDDFPAPQPEGANAEIRAMYGHDIQGFFRNHWWPSMKTLTWDYGVRYTGVLVETYNDDVEPPLDEVSGDKSLIRYYASELLQSGGEMGLHGYNHMPLCLDGFPFVDEDYNTWHSVTDMAVAVKELYRYAQEFMPGASYQTYVPPSNYLTKEGQWVMLENVPSLRTISGLYLPEEGYSTLLQEFCEEADGSVSVPRITSGFTMSEYDRLVMSSELMLHGVYSHFIHPDDVLDSDRSKGLTWDVMFDNFQSVVAQIASEYPMLRWSTASEGAAAVQRYDRLKLTREYTDAGVLVRLEPFYDEAWLALYTNNPIGSVFGAECYEVDEGLYWLHATGALVGVTWGARE